MININDVASVMYEKNGCYAIQYRMNQDVVCLDAGYVVEQCEEGIAVWFCESVYQKGNIPEILNEYLRILINAGFTCKVGNNRVIVIA